jgi:nickel/cobalt exporter
MFANPTRSRVFRLSIAASVFLVASVASAHPVPKDSHDRTIVVKLQKAAVPDKMRVLVEYRLEVDETTVFLNDMKPFKDKVNPLDYRGEPLKYYAKFAEEYAPIYADRLTAKVGKKPSVEFRCLSHKEQLQDEDGKSLGHLRCDFVFEGVLDIDPAKKMDFFFREHNYLLEQGQIVLSLVNETGLTIESKTEPDDAFRKRAMERPEPGDDDLLREISVVFAAVKAAPKIQLESPKKTATPPQEAEPKETHEDSFSLLQLILHTDYGFWLTLFFAFLIGAAHALTPGHGKTLVAAYLVGERGTIWHAMFLGLVTTLTHTGVVIILAVIMALLPNDAQLTFQNWIQHGLGLVLGLTVACMGFWLLLQRLAGKADHVHIGSGHHGPSARELSWWGLVMLGVTGGIVPCWDAIILLFYTVGTSRFWLVLPAVLAFSAGLAVVLVLIGILVVQVPRFVEARGGDGRLLRSLPTLSAIAVMLVGVWLCFEWSQGR